MGKGINCIGPEYYGQVPWMHHCILNSIVQLIAACSFLVLSPATMPSSCQALCCYFLFSFLMFIDNRTEWSHRASTPRNNGDLQLMPTEMSSFFSPLSCSNRCSLCEVPICKGFIWMIFHILWFVWVSFLPVSLISWPLLWPACSCCSALSPFPPGAVRAVQLLGRWTMLGCIFSSCRSRGVIWCFTQPTDLQSWMALEVPGCTDPKAASCYWSFSQHKAEGGSLAEEQAFPLVAFHFPLQLELAVTLELACLQCLLSTPIFIIIFNLCDHSTSSLCLSLFHLSCLLPFSMKTGLKDWAKNMAFSIILSHPKIVMFLIETLPPCSLVHL